MIPVEQRELGGPDSDRRGDCLNACVASLLELPYSHVPYFNLHGEAWWSLLLEFFESHGYGIWRIPLWGETLPKLRSTKLLNHVINPPGYWIASVKSPRLKEADGEPALHAVVMYETGVAWDPNPGRAQGHLGFVEGWVPVPAGIRR